MKTISKLDFNKLYLLHATNGKVKYPEDDLLRHYAIQGIVRNIIEKQNELIDILNKLIKKEKNNI